MSSEVDPMQITVAVFDRFVYKFKEVLEVRELDPSLIRDALKTLNELVHHQVSIRLLPQFLLGNG
jgi:glycosylphosphatidylinositol transamidase (GPIT) subunit GPI8